MPLALSAPDLWFRIPDFPFSSQMLEVTSAHASVQVLVGFFILSAHVFAHGPSPWLSCCLEHVTCIFFSVRGCVCTMADTRKSEDNLRASVLTTWVLRIRLRSLGLLANTFTRGAILPALLEHLFVFHRWRFAWPAGVCDLCYALGQVLQLGRGLTL